MLKLLANWPAPSHVKALTTTRRYGNSKPPYDQNNLGLHVGDNPEQVLLNRCGLIASLNLPKEPEWLLQTHSTHCINVDNDITRNADAAITHEPNRVLAIMTADCLPIMLCNQQGTEIAAIHAGWRGLVNGIIENSIAKLKSHPTNLMAWIAPSICQACYEVGDEIRSTILSKYEALEACFMPSPQSTQHTPKWLANLPQIAEEILKRLTINAVYQSNVCTFEQKEYFYSYRRMPQTGRIATLIWFI
ncbi:MAG: polyphenol oxidase [Legionellales bacterium RIFCSPHIGHO2_12_FULL_42_9]|nr:MAG: polyphenol oxidase [Legionellales bacterium RIFCSPHIGHO2_12_FULL_42_9]